MASSTTQKPSSSSSPPTRNFNFEVFLSFRGEDTRNNFTDHLFVDLNRMGIHTFRDDQLKRGEEIKSELLKTIEDSRISIVVFSENYAHSKWCLDELAKIMECKTEMKQMVYPVFYHVDPSGVRKQTGSFGEAFSIHERNVKEEKVQRWRAAMTEASNLSGCHVKDDEYESSHIKKITNEILKRLNPKLLHIEGEIVGMNLRLKELKVLLNSHLNDVRVVGIYGTGGIGKTTIARIIYNEIRCQFDGTSFLQDVKERSKNGCRVQLQQQLLKGVVGKDIKFIDIDEGINIIKDRLSSKKVFIVIDDVDDLNQLQPLVRREWFGSGSRIIVTTRNQHLLNEFGVDTSYEVKKLHDEEAIQLFNMHAFKQNVPKIDYACLSKCIVNYAQGLPLALKVIGSSLYGMKLPEWESKLAKLKKYSDKKINDVLRIGYDELDESEKKVFLDIACFFKGEDKDFVLSILDSCNLFATYNTRVLCNRCLITISNNKVEMHDLIQQMGWSIVREKCPEDPSEWSRLWDLDDIDKAFSKENGMKNIETISLDLSRSKEIQFSSKAFGNMKKVSTTMKKLRLLKVYYCDYYSLMRREYKVLLPKDFEFPPNLIYLHWEGYTSKSLPSNFHGENLVALNLKFSNIKELWKSDKHLAELKFMDLSYSEQLIKIPECSKMPKLERLILQGCTSFHNLDSFIGVYHDMKFLWKLYLTKILRKLNFSESGIKELPSSIGSLTSLETLNLSWCSKFKKFPDIFANMGSLRELHLNGTGIEELPSSIGSLTSLELLNLQWCLKFEKFPDIFENMGNLTELFLFQSGIKELPSSIGYLESLETLNLSCCSNFEKFPGTLGNMRWLKNLDLSESAIKELPNNIGCLGALQTLSLSHCSRLEKLPEFHSNMGSLRRLSINGSAIKELPRSMGHFPQLQSLDMRNCKNLTSVPSSIFELKSLDYWSLNGCSNLEIFPEITEDMEHLKILHLSESAITALPSSIERLKGLETLKLSNCKNVKTLPNSIGNLTCLKVLDIGGCNMMEGAIPSDLWCLSSLISLNLRENNIRCIPTGIIQLSQLKTLCMNHCPMLEEIPELPSSLRTIEAHGCPCVETLSTDPTHLLWSYLLNYFKSQIQNFVKGTFIRHRIWNGVPNVVIPGKSGIPEWISHKRMGREIEVELPKNWYEDNNLLGFALFFHHVPLDDDDDICKTIYYCTPPHHHRHKKGPRFKWSISHGDQFECMGSVCFSWNCRTDSINDLEFQGLEDYHKDSISPPDPALRVVYFPKIAISSEHRSNWGNKFKARFLGPFNCGPKDFKVESCGIHLIYNDAQDHRQQSLQILNVKRRRDNTEDRSPTSQKIQGMSSSSFLRQDDSKQKRQRHF